MECSDIGYDEEDQKQKEKEGIASNSDIEERPHFLSSIFDCVWESDGGTQQ